MPLTKDSVENRLRVLGARYAEIREKLDDLNLEDDNEAIEGCLEDLEQSFTDAEETITENEPDDEDEDEDE